jgi:glyoxylase-like metal-dependent hydrolase (beta-lactamase superfamily II)
MNKIIEGVYFIQGQDEFIPDSHVYIIGKPASKDLTMIDAGLIGKGKNKISAIEQSEIALGDIKRVIMTHTHMDHIGCLDYILEKIPHAELWVHRNEAEALEQGDESSVYGMDMFRNMCQSQFSIKPGAFTFKVDRKLEGGETVEIGSMIWEALHLPGHSLGSIALYNRMEKILISGDVIYSDYAIGRFDLFGANGAQLKDSLFKIAELKVNLLLPGHNQIVEDLPSGYILETAKQWEPYLV